MSQVMESPLVNGNSASRQSEPANLVEPQQGFDIVKVLWRWKWLPILGSVLGTVLGYLYYSKQPAQYQAMALVQVIDSSPVPVQAFETNKVSNMNTMDESLVIRSEAVMQLAVELGQLTDLPSMKAEGLNAKGVMFQLLESKNLFIEPAAKDAKTTLIEIGYICNSEEEAARVVNSIVTGYKTYLANEYSSVGTEVRDLITGAQGKVEEEFRKLYKEYDDFRTNAPTDIIWSGTDATDPYFELFNSVKKELTSLQMERDKLQGTIAHVERGIAEGHAPEQLLLWLSQNDERELYDPRIQPRFANRPELPAVEMRTNTESARLARTALFEHKTKEESLVDTLGDGHPTVVNLRKKIDSIKTMLAELSDLEKKEDDELRRIYEEHEKEMLGAGGFSIDQRLVIRVNALKEKYAALAIHEQGLMKLAAENRKQSRELQDVMYQNRMHNERLIQFQKLVDLYTEKVNAISLLPPPGQRTLKELNTPDLGAFYGPKLPPYILGGAAVGFILLSGLAVLMDLADRSYRSPDEIAADLRIPVLGHIPIIETQKFKKVIEQVDLSVTTVHHSRGRASEAFRAVRTGLFFSNRGSELKVIQVTSPVPGDGKSTLSSNLAVTMAQSGRRVLLIDADFRRPRIAKIFGIESKVGMAQVVAGKAELDDATFASGVANLSIMPGGKQPKNPAELLSSSRFEMLVDMLREKYDIIILDTPPLLAVSEPSAVAAIVDGVVITMRLRRNVKPLATRAVKILESVDAKLLGVVINGVSGEAGYGYSYGYNDYRYAYRYGGNHRYGYKYGYGGKYGNYSAGYIDDSEQVTESGDRQKADS